MATYTKICFSGATDGCGPIENLPFQTWSTIHSTLTSSSVLDEVWLYIQNRDSSGALPIGFRVGCNIGGSLSQYGRWEISSGQTMLVLPGIPVNGNGSVATNIQVYDHSGIGNLTVFGYVNRITP